MIPQNIRIFPITIKVINGYIYFIVIVLDYNKGMLIDNMTLRRQTKMKSETLKEQKSRNELILEDLYFDGRNNNIVIVETNG